MIARVVDSLAVLVVTESGISEPLIHRNIAPADLAVQMVVNRTGGRVDFVLLFVVEPEVWLLAWIVCELLALIYNGMVEMVEAVGPLCFGPDVHVRPVGYESAIGYEGITV